MIYLGTDSVAETLVSVMHFKGQSGLHLIGKQQHEAVYVEIGPAQPKPFIYLCL